MPTPTYVALATLTASGGETSVTFSSIPATYRDLIVVSTFTQSNSSTSAAIQFNSDTGTNYSYVAMSGSGPGATSGSSTHNLIYVPIFNASSGTPVFDVTQVMDYSASKHKTSLHRQSSTRDFDSSFATTAMASRWANTAAITSIEIFMRAGNFNIGSTFSLYGIAS